MSADGTHQGSGLQRRQDGSTAIPAGGSLDIESGGALKIAGSDVTAKLAALPSAAIVGAGVAAPVAGVAAGYKVARGVSAVTGTLEVTSGLATVVSVVPVLAEDAALTGLVVTVAIPTQTGGDAGKFTLKVWKPTGAGDVTPIAADAAKNVAWIAVGT